MGRLKQSAIPRSGPDTGRRPRKAHEKRKSKPKDETIFPFLSLPAELRTQIYELAIFETVRARCNDEGRIEINCPGSFDYQLVEQETAHDELVDEFAEQEEQVYRRAAGSNDIDGPLRADPSYVAKFSGNQPYLYRSDLVPAQLLATCKQIYAEALHYLYNHHFILPTNREFVQWMNQIGEAKKLIEMVCIDKWFLFGGGDPSRADLGIHHLKDLKEWSFFNVDKETWKWTSKPLTRRHKSRVSDLYLFAQDDTTSAWNKQELDQLFGWAVWDPPKEYDSS